MVTESLNNNVIKKKGYWDRFSKPTTSLGILYRLNQYL